MNSIFKITSLAIIALSVSSINSAGQPVCKISYAYDISGNRVERKYGCVTPNDNNPHGTQPWRENEVLLSLFPNPTSGGITGTYSEPTANVYVGVSTIGGVKVQEWNFPQLMSFFTIDISAQVPGTYLLTVIASNKMETFTIIKQQ